MTRAHLLRMVADCGGGSWPMPSVVDGLKAPQTPALYFHNVTREDIQPWLDALSAWSQESKHFPAEGFVVTTWRAAHLGLDLQIKLYVPQETL